MKYEIPEMLKQGKRSHRFTCTVAGLVGFAGLPAYVASKHGIVGLKNYCFRVCQRRN
jgi:NAD(P)-dependent dehydrogenase (short-subunit alcohol dehydrogenase family)